MVSDVRMKIKFRLELFIQEMNKRAVEDIDIIKLRTLAHTDFEAAQYLRANARSDFVRNFEGCELRFTRQYVYLMVPSGYPNAQVPIMVSLPPALVECLMPKGMSKRPY